MLAGNGAEALKILTGEDPPRLAVLDWRMPHMEGPEVCQQLRRLQAENDYTYVIILTARGGADDFELAIDAGTDEFVTKPVKEVDLKFRLSNGKRIVRLYRELADARTEIAQLKRADSTLVHNQ